MDSFDLRDLSLFARCGENDLDPVRGAITGYRTFAPGDAVCEEGERPNQWWIVTRGEAEVSAGGHRLGAIGAGETIGELALLEGGPRGATVRATTELETLEVDGLLFFDALRSSPGLSLALLRELAHRLRTANEHAAPPS